MKIAIDSGPLTGGHSVRGIGVNTRELTNELKKLKTKELDVEVVDFSTTDLSKYDIVHYPYFEPYFLTLPMVKPSNRVIVTIHDLIKLIYPKHYPPGVKGKLRFIEQKRRLKNVDAIMTISETSKKDIVRFLKVDPKIVHVIYLAPKKIFKPITNHQLPITTQKKFNLPKSLVLYVGDVNYNKNIPTLIEACKLAGVFLVIAGKEVKEILARGSPLHPELVHLEGLKLNHESVVTLGYVSDEELVNLYNLASVYVQPSLYEGFGLPVLEALACGTPVVASKIQAHMEIAGNSVDYFDPKNAQKLAKKIKTAKYKDEFAKAILARYSWRTTAKDMLKIYKKVYGGKK